MTTDLQILKADGFTGFRPFADLDLNDIPSGLGIYAVVMPPRFIPRFLAESVGGHFKGQDPSLREDSLAAKWVKNTDVLYIGKAGPGKAGRRGLRRRIQEFMDFGRGKPVGHWGGRLLWQLADSQSLLIAWKVLSPELVDPAEASYQAAFVRTHGRLPFANLVQARTR